MTTKNAVDLKDKGNAFFKSGQMVQAAECYAKAEKAAKNDPVYPSNLSAALYEMGDYSESVEAICRSWKTLSSDSNPALALKLSIRIAKALSQGVRSGSISPDLLKKHAQAIDQLEVIAQQQSAETSTALPEHARVWKDWRLIAEEDGDREEAALQAHRRLSRLPILKKSFNPALEYYTIGQDPIMCLFSDWGPDDTYPLMYKRMSKAQLSQIAFLFGGVGDARHVYGTLIGTHRAYLLLDKTKRAQLRVHMTLLDLHPSALARDLCVMMFLHSLTDTNQSVIERTEIKATIFYMYLGVVLPGYCYERLQNTIRDIKQRLTESPPRLPDWLHVNSCSIPSIIESLDYWSNLPDTKTTAGILRVHEPHSSSSSNITLLNNPNLSPEYRKMIQNTIASKRQQAGAMLDGLTDAQVMQLGFAEPGQTPAQARRMLASKREHVIDVLVESQMDGNVAARTDKEQEWYQVTKTFMPPVELWSRHPGYEKFRQFKATGPLSKEAMKTMKEHVVQSWKPNATLIDRTSPTFAMVTTGYPDLKTDPFKSVREIADYNDRFKLGDSKKSSNPDTPAYSHAITFFDGVVDALKDLVGHVKIEILRGDLIQEMCKMRFQGDESRPAEFPRLFTRAWLSNVPDYTHGLINTCVYIQPALQSGDASAVASNSLLNSGIWKDNEEFCHTYTLLRTQDVPRFLGCRLIRKDGVMGLIVLGSPELPRPLAELASREELIAWLTRVFLYTIVPGTGGIGPFRARLPNNLVAFFGLLVHLRGVGFPSHWLSDFLQSIVSDSLITTIAPYLGKWPIPVSDITRRVSRRKVRLDPWRAELETILATAHEGMPFAVSLPADFARKHTNIGVFEAMVKTTSYNFTGSPATNDPVVFLMFYKPGQGATGPKELVSAIPALLEGRKMPAPGNLFILTAQEAFDLPNGTVRWKFSRDRVHTMRREGWCLVAYRSDTQEPFTQPVPASQWKNIDPVHLPFMDILPLD